MGITVSRRTTKNNLAVRRKHLQTLTVSRRKVNHKNLSLTCNGRKLPLALKWLKF